MMRKLNKINKGVNSAQDMMLNCDCSCTCSCSCTDPQDFEFNHKSGSGIPRIVNYAADKDGTVINSMG